MAWFAATSAWRKYTEIRTARRAKNAQNLLGPEKGVAEMYENDSLGRYLRVLAYAEAKNQKKPEEPKKEKPEDPKNEQEAQYALAQSRKERR